VGAEAPLGSRTESWSREVSRDLAGPGAKERRGSVGAVAPCHGIPMRPRGPARNLLGVGCERIDAARTTPSIRIASAEPGRREGNGTVSTTSRAPLIVRDTKGVPHDDASPPPPLLRSPRRPDVRGPRERSRRVGVDREGGTDAFEAPAGRRRRGRRERPPPRGEVLEGRAGRFDALRRGAGALHVPARERG